MTAEEIYIKLRDELTAENDSSSSPERIFIKHDGQTICTLGMNRSHEIIFVEFKPAQKDLAVVEREGFVHPHPVEMLHDAGWRQAQLTSWEEAERLLEIIERSYKRKKSKSETPPSHKGGSHRRAKIEAIRAARLAQRGKGTRKVEPEKPAAGIKKLKKAANPAPKPAAKPQPKTKSKPARKAKPKAAPRSKAQKKAAKPKAAKKKKKR